MTRRPGYPDQNYLAHAGIWTVLDLIAQEFKSDPTSVQCFDLRLMKRTIELAATGRPTDDELMKAAENLLDWIILQYETVSKASARLAVLSILMGVRDRGDGRPTS